MTVRLEKCRFFARHGVMTQERTVGNEFEVTVAVDYNASIFNGDDISATISYADLYEIAKEEMMKPRNLLESVAVAVADRIEKIAEHILKIRVEIRKITPPIAGIDGSASIDYARYF